MTTSEREELDVAPPVCGQGEALSQASQPVPKRAKVECTGATLEYRAQLAELAHCSQCLSSDLSEVGSSDSDQSADFMGDTAAPSMSKAAPDMGSKAPNLGHGGPSSARPVPRPGGNPGSSNLFAFAIWAVGQLSKEERTRMCERKLSVISVCAGMATEVMVTEALDQALRHHRSPSLQVSHLAVCELSPFKRDFIRKHVPGIK